MPARTRSHVLSGTPRAAGVTPLGPPRWTRRPGRAYPLSAPLGPHLGGDGNGIDPVAFEFARPALPDDGQEAVAARRHTEEGYSAPGTDDLRNQGDRLASRAGAVLRHRVATARA